jgi:hypothetical protein
MIDLSEGKNEREKRRFSFSHRGVEALRLNIKLDV